MTPLSFQLYNGVVQLPTLHHIHHHCITNQGVPAGSQQKETSPMIMSMVSVVCVELRTVARLVSS